MITTCDMYEWIKIDGVSFKVSKETLRLAAEASKRVAPPAGELKLRVIVPDCLFDMAREIYDDCVEVIRQSDTYLPATSEGKSDV